MDNWPTIKAFLEEHSDEMGSKYNDLWTALIGGDSSRLLPAMTEYGQMKDGTMVSDHSKSSRNSNS
jgi:hypothetical protein